MQAPLRLTWQQQHPSGSCCSFGPWWHGNTFLHHSTSQLLGPRYWKTPQTRFAPPKLQQPWVQLVDIAPLPAWLVGQPCSTRNLLCWRWRSWCGMVCVELPQRNKGIEGTRPSTLRLGQIKYGRHCGWGLVEFRLSFHRTWSGQVQGLAGAVEHQISSDVVVTVLILVRVIWVLELLPASRFQMASEIKLRACTPVPVKRDIWGLIKDIRVTLKGTGALSEQYSASHTV